MTPAAVNHTNAGEIGAHGSEDELVERKTRFLLVQSMKVQPGLNGEPSRTKILQVKPSSRLNRGFNVFGSLLHLDIAVS
jgi:hypothetical protein